MDSVKLISNYEINFPNGLFHFTFFEQEIAALSLVGLRPFTNGIKSLLALRLTSTCHINSLHCEAEQFKLQKTAFSLVKSRLALGTTVG